MYKIIYPTHDTTIYSQYPERNTSADQILEIVKSTAGQPSLDNDDTVFWSTTYNSRIFIKFDLTEVSQSVSTGKIDGNTAQYFLKLSATDATNLPISYTIFAYPVSGTWTNGTGFFNNNPQIKNGTSWKYRSDATTATSWATSSYVANTTGSYGTIVGGGNWYTNLVGSQSFDNEAPDVYMNVTQIVNGWLSGSIQNNGFVVKLSDAAEFDSTIFQSLQFFSENTHTVFLPKLEIYWNSSDLSGTSSFIEISDDNFRVNVKNLRESYATTEKPKIRLGVHDRFPTQTYSTSSVYLNAKRFTTSSYYQVQDVVTDEVIVPFNSTGTRINCDSTGNYIQLDCNSFMPERYYKLVYKTEWEGGNTVRLIDDNHIFKIRRN